MPAFNFDRAQTVASLQRIKKIASNVKATVIIQHDARRGEVAGIPGGREVSTQARLQSL